LARNHWACVRAADHITLNFVVYSAAKRLYCVSIVFLLKKCPETKAIKQLLKEFFECFREKAVSMSFALLILDNGDFLRILKKGFD
jgi:hypothetical protein